MPGEKPPPPEVEQTALAQEMRAAYPIIAEYLDGKIEGLKEAVKSVVKEEEWQKKRIAEATQKENFLNFTKGRVERASMKAFEAEEARRDFEKGEIHPVAEMLLEDVNELFAWFENAQQTRDGSRSEELRKNIKSSLSALAGLLEDRPGAK